MSALSVSARSANAGFTLIEVVVAAGIFAVAGAMAYGGLNTVLRTRAHLEESAARLARLQTAFAILQQDIEQAVGRGVRDEFGDSLPAMRGGTDGVLLELTRRAAGPVLHGQPVDLRRIEYAREGDTLVRQVWEVLDRTQSSSAAPAPLLDGVAGVDLSFHQGGWLGHWPPGRSRADLSALPAGVSVTLHMTDGVSARRVFLVRAREGV
jgi:general secretion pathway protein J